MIEHRILKPRYEDQPKVYSHNTRLLDDEARFALSLVDRWGMVAGIEDGEDSAGRAQMRLATPQELVDRATAVTELLFQRIEAEGWIHHLESIDGMIAIVAARHESDAPGTE